MEQCAVCDWYVVCAQVGRAVEHVHKATKQLESAKTLQKSTRKWMCCALVVFLIILVIVVVVVVKPWQKKK